MAGIILRHFKVNIRRAQQDFAKHLKMIIKTALWRLNKLRGAWVLIHLECEFEIHHFMQWFPTGMFRHPWVLAINS